MNFPHCSMFPKISDYGTLKRYGLYLFFIGLGVGLNEAARWLWKRRPRRKKRTFWESASTVGELVQLLSLSGEKRFDEVIRALEEEKMDLREAKKKIKIARGKTMINNNKCHTF